MTRTIFSLALAAVMALGVATSYAQNTVSGDWSITINGPQGAMDSDATLTQDGETVTGTMTTPMGESDLTGTMTGTTLTLAFNVVSPQGPIDVTMTAEVTGADMKGVLDFGMGTADFTGKKK